MIIPSKDAAESRRTTEVRFALFLPSLDGGGAERMMLNLGTTIQGKGYPVDIVLATAKGALLNSTPPTVRVVDLAASRPLTAVPALARYLRRERPRAMLATITNANLAALWAIRLSGVDTRCVVREASTLSVELEHSSTLNRLLVPRMIARAFPLAHAIIAPSRGVADDLAAVTRIPRESIRVIYNPVLSAGLFARAKEPVSHGWLNDRTVPVIVGMGRLTRQKDFGTLIRAFARIKERRRSRLLILGEGEDRGALEALSKSLGVAEDVDLPGFLSNPYAVLSRAALFVLSSRWEGLPGVLIEALACGAKVVATDCPSGPREILDNGAFGELVPIEDEQSMAAAMERALSGEFVAADASSRMAQFDLETNTSRYLELLDG
jgi:glycosyltransferase involved in cell wall biosynthesis